MVDFNVEKMFARAIREKEYYYNNWLFLTKRMFRNFPAILVYSKVDEALEMVSNEQWKKGYPKTIFDKNFKYPNPILSDTLKRILNLNLKITDVAKNYGLKVRGRKAICPFHPDTQPSLSLTDGKNLFNCFGCGAKGDIIKFIGMLEDAKKGSNKKSS